MRPGWRRRPVVQVGAAPAAAPGTGTAGVEAPWDPSQDGDVVLDIGGGIGALVVVTGPDRADREIEVQRARLAVRAHVAVRERHGDGRVRHAAVFPTLAEDDYTVWDRGEDGPLATVRVVGGSVTWLDWS